MRLGNERRRRGGLAEFGERRLPLSGPGERQAEDDARVRLLFAGLRVSGRVVVGVRGLPRGGQRRPQHGDRLGAAPGLVEQRAEPEPRPPVLRIEPQRLPVARLGVGVLPQVVQDIPAAEVRLRVLRGGVRGPLAGGLRRFEPLLARAEEADLEQRARIARPERQRRLEPPAGFPETPQPGVERPQVVLRLEGAGIRLRRGGQRGKSFGAPALLDEQDSERGRALPPGPDARRAGLPVPGPPRRPVPARPAPGPGRAALQGAPDPGRAPPAAPLPRRPTRPVRGAPWPGGRARSGSPASARRAPRRGPRLRRRPRGAAAPPRASRAARVVRSGAAHFLQVFRRLPDPPVLDQSARLGEVRRLPGLGRRGKSDEQRAQDQAGQRGGGRPPASRRGVGAGGIGVRGWGKGSGVLSEIRRRSAGKGGGKGGGRPMAPGVLRACFPAITILPNDVPPPSPNRPARSPAAFFVPLPALLRAPGGRARRRRPPPARGDRRRPGPGDRRPGEGERTEREGTHRGAPGSAPDLADRRSHLPDHRTGRSGSS